MQQSQVDTSFNCRASLVQPASSVGKSASASTSFDEPAIGAAGSSVDGDHGRYASKIVTFISGCGVSIVFVACRND